MHKFYFTFIFLFTFFIGESQSIQGKVFDENNLPLEGVSVYFDGTTLGTTTNIEGIFELKSLALPNSILVISYIGYEAVYLNSIQSSLEIKLKPIAISLNEVLLEPIPFTRKELLAVFRAEFLGKTKGGKKCVILNEEAIQFSYNSKDFKLSAFADETLKIKNFYLGYNVEFNLMDFTVLFNKRTLDKNFMKGSFFSGTSYFQEFKEPANTFLKNRNKSYLGSSKHFFKNLIDNKWGKKEFILYEGSMPTDPKLHFEVTNEGSLKKITIFMQPIIIDTKAKPMFYQRFQLLYNNNEQSAVIFRTSFFYVDEFGNNTDIDKIDFTGDIAKRRIGDMLPVNFIITN